MSYGMRSNDYFSKYDDRFGSGNRQTGGMRYGAESSFSQFRDRGDLFRDTFSRTNSSNFGNGMGGEGGFGDRRSGGMGMQDYNMGYNNMRGRSDYNVRSPLMRGMKRNISSGSGFGGRSQGAMGMSGNLSTTEALLSLGLQAKQLLEKQAVGYGPPAAKMRRLNEGYGGPMMRGRGMMRRGMTRGGAARARGGSTRLQKLREVPAWRKTPFHCNFCHKATKNRKDHAEHVKTKEHSVALKEREKKLIERMYSLLQHSQANAEHARMERRLVRFCNICTLEYTGKITLHKKSKEHLAMVFLLHVKCGDCEITIPNRIQYERHNATQFHIRNHMYKRMEADELAESDEELECPEEYDENTIVGSQYVNDRRSLYCKVCDKLFLSKDIKVYDHCKSQEHFDNFKVFVVTRKAELKEKAAEKAKKAEEAAAAKEAASDEKKDKDADEEAEEDGEKAEDEEEAVDGEGEDAEEVDEEQALPEENENEDVEMEEAEEKEASPKKSPAAKARTTPKRNAKAK